jgi:hypothetical protein
MQTNKQKSVSGTTAAAVNVAVAMQKLCTSEVTQLEIRCGAVKGEPRLVLYHILETAIAPDLVKIQLLLLKFLFVKLAHFKQPTLI